MKWILTEIFFFFFFICPKVHSDLTCSKYSIIHQNNAATKTDNKIIINYQKVSALVISSVVLLKPSSKDCTIS